MKEHLARRVLPGASTYSLLSSYFFHCEILTQNMFLDISNNLRISYAKISNTKIQGLNKVSRLALLFQTKYITRCTLRNAITRSVAHYSLESYYDSALKHNLLLCTYTHLLLCTYTHLHIHLKPSSHHAV